MASLREIRRKIKSVKSMVVWGSRLAAIGLAVIFLGYRPFVFADSPLVGKSEIKSAQIDHSGDIRIFYQDGSKAKVPKAANESSYDGVKIAPDKRVVGWGVFWPHELRKGERLSNEVDVYSGQVIRIDADQTIFEWNFWKDGDHIAIHSGPLHGSLGIARLYNLSKSTTQCIETYNYDTGSSPPDWVSELR